MKSKPRSKQPTKLTRRTTKGPSLIRPEVTARRMGGRPKKLTPAFIASFLGHLSLGLHLSQAAALEGVAGTQIDDWLRIGRKNIAAGIASIEGEFSVAVRKKLAELQQQELGTLTLCQRMAEGWSPTCKTCRSQERPCGAHAKDLRLVADLAKWKLTHRFPKHWNTSTVAIDVANGDDETCDRSVMLPADADGGPRAAVALMMYVPKRREIDE